MKKKIISIALCGLLLANMPAVLAQDEETIQFHDKTFSVSELSQETVEWLEWYNSLSEEEQLKTSYVPSELLDLSLIHI